MKEEKNLNKIAKYLSDNSVPKEREDLFAWVKESPKNKALLEEGMEVWEMAEDANLDFQPKMDVAWAKMEQRLNKARAKETVETPIRKLHFFKPWMRIAAAALILLGIALWLFPTSNENWIKEQTVANEKTSIDLPDGTKVWLNQNSQLKYEKLFDKRVVYLEGEAFFEVEKMPERPFEVFANGSKTKVLGTSFNIRAYDREDKVELSVESGKVAFTSTKTSKKDLLLTPGEFATYTKENHELKKHKMGKLNAAAWKKGALRFNNSKMEEVIESLERYYNIEIEVSNDNIYNCTWVNTKTFEKPMLENILKLLEFAGNMDIQSSTTKDNLYYISGEGCE